MSSKNESLAGGTSAKWAVWRLRKGMDRRFRAGHPWVYSNELMESPKGLEPGSWVQLQDAGGKFLAWGYGNPKSLISFRSLSRKELVNPAVSSRFVLDALLQAEKLRVASGLGQFSHRLCYGESDGLPGLVIDRYSVELKSAIGQVYVVQAHTAGADRILSGIVEILKQLSSAESWDHTAIVLRNDLGVRKLEGLAEEEPKILKAIDGLDLSQARVRVAPVLSSGSNVKPVVFQTDLAKGQKTGFFLDQFANIQLAAMRFQNLFETNANIHAKSAAPRQGARQNPQKIRILDLCCYVGQWGTQLSRVFKELGYSVEVVCVDASQQALGYAQKNIEAQGAICQTLKADVLKDLAQLESGSFDIVISDPPALIKSRKDIPVGKHAYLQLATQAFRLVKKGGGIVCCSCSALLEEEAFEEALIKGASRNQAEIKWLGKGSQSPDHPMLLEFPEGRYLKSWVGIVG